MSLKSLWSIFMLIILSRIVLKLMESRKKRGLSLTHQQPTATNVQRSLEKSSLPQTTRMHCSLYQISYTVRMPSAPKTKVQFSYPNVHSPSINLPLPQAQINQVSVFRTSCDQPYRKQMHYGAKENQQPIAAEKNIHNQLSKKSLGKKAGSIHRRQKDQHSHHLSEHKNDGFCQVSIEQYPSSKTKPEAAYRRKRQLDIHCQVVNYFAENKPFSNKFEAEPQVQIGQNPQKLQEMEKRLLDLIKICDENL